MSAVYGLQVYSGIQNSDAIPNIQLIFPTYIGLREMLSDRSCGRRLNVL